MPRLVDNRNRSKVLCSRMLQLGFGSDNTLHPRTLLVAAYMLIAHPQTFYLTDRPSAAAA